MSKYFNARAVQKYAPKAYRFGMGAVKRGAIYGPAVKQLASDVMYLKGLVNAEPQRFGYQATGNFDFNGTILTPCQVPQADTYGSRTGDRILPKHFNLRMHINKDTAGRMHTTVRYIIFRWWGQSAGSSTVPNVNNVIQAANVGTAYAPVSALNEDCIGSKGDRNRRIEVHRSGMVTFDTVSKTSLDVEENISLNGKGKQVKEHMEFPGAATTNPSDGGFYILLISDYNVAGDVSYTIQTQLSYYDN